MSTALDAYPRNYDDVLVDVHERIAESGRATKLDLAALITWKHVQNAPWMVDLLELPGAVIEGATRNAFTTDIDDQQRIHSLAALPGFGSGGAFTSVLFAAWDPKMYGVYDKLVMANRPQVVNQHCTCNWENLPTYWCHLREISAELQTALPMSEAPWTPRKVDMAMWKLKAPAIQN